MGAALVSGVVSQAIADNYDAIKAAVQNGLNQGKALAQAVEDAAAEVGGAASALWDKTGEEAEELINEAGEFIEDFAEGLDQFIKEVGSDAQDLLQGLQLAMQSDTPPVYDPLVLDLNNNGISLSSVSDSHAYFNLQDRGFATVNGWVTGGDGLLAVDENANGKIDGVDELFGSATQSGFQELAQLDSNQDGKITSADAAWNNLRVWVDADEDGTTDAGELHTLSDLSITEIGLMITQVNQTINGNTLVETASFKMNGADRTIGEVLLQSNATNSVYAGELEEIAFEALKPPFLRGYGIVADTPVAMTLDSTLLAMSQSLQTAGTLGNFNAFTTDFRVFLFKWAGVDGVDPASRGAGSGSYPNAQELAFLEHYTGTSYVTPAGHTDPFYFTAWQRIDDLFDSATEGLALKFLVQNDATLQSVARYDIASDAILLTTTETAALEAATVGLSANAAALFWASLSQIHAEDAATLTAMDFILDKIALTAADLTASQKEFFNLDAGTSGNDANLDGMDKHRADLIVGAGGNDNNNIFSFNNVGSIFSGGDGNDTVTARSGLLIGGRGDDTLVANGSDKTTFFFRRGDGHDEILATINGTDKIVFAADIAPADVTYARSGVDLFINIDGGDSIKVRDFFKTDDFGATFHADLEQVVFADETVHTPSDFFAGAVSWIGTGGNDTLYGTSVAETIDGLGGNDMILGGEGNDTLLGNVGADDLYGGEGSDALNGGADADILRGMSGNDTLAGGMGDDALRGSIGDDTYIFSSGDGDDILTEAESILNVPNGNDKIVFDASVSKASVTYVLSNSDLLISYGTLGDTVRVTNFFSVTASGTVPNVDLYEIERVELSDGTFHDLSYIYAQALTQTGTAANETLSAIGSNYRVYNNTLRGMGGNDALNGSNGNDMLDGGIGNDNMSGGSGNDTYIVDSASDIVNDTVNAGTDTVRSSIAFTLGVNTENLILTSAAAAAGTGNALDNTLDGSQGTGANALSGGAGNDTYILSTGDTATEAASAGTDTVRVGFAYTLGANVENLTLTGASAVAGTGNTLDNILDGSQNTAVNALSGSTGNDTYILGAGDTVTEAASAGTDTVIAAATYTLGANVEKLTLSGSANINATGNTLVNTLTGNAGNNTLDGLAGADAMLGGAGDDTYFVDNAADTVTELSNEGTDLVQSAVTWTLGNNIENLFLTGTGNVNAIGNSLDNLIVGNTGNNTLNGGAGNDTLSSSTGTDTLIGGTGNDIINVNDAFDVVIENANEGIDTIHLAGITSYTLGNNLENLIFVGTAQVTGTGNTLDNAITGNAIANTLNGMGGNDTLSGLGGADVLSGGTGNDTFVFDAASAFGAIDTITDFNVSTSEDVLDLRGVLAEYDPLTELLSDFVQISNSGANSTVSVDRDGAGTSFGFTQIATLSNITGLTDEEALRASGNILVG